MEEHPEDRLVFGGAAIVVGVLFIAFAMITAFDIRYLFTGTLPFIAIGVCLMVYGWYALNKEVDENGQSRQTIRFGRTKTKIHKDQGTRVRKHHIHVGENRKERRLREKREKKENSAIMWD